MSTPSNRILADKYRLIHPLDQGGMGSVWLAEHLSLASPVAVKLIATEFGTSEERRQRFLREAHAAAALRSPHVVSTLDYGVDGDTPYIVMELLEGESLADRLARRGCLAPQEVEFVLRHVSRAVARAHELGIVHRDLKPANIFVTRNDEEEIVKIFDFGIAKTETDPSAAQHTRTGSLLGTPAYMSPEQLQGRHCDYRADIWAMGVISYECLTGQLPFAGAGLGGLVLAVCSDPLPLPSERAVVPDGFDVWFARACARAPEQRFSSAREAARELRRVLTPELDTGEPAERALIEAAEHLAPPALPTARWSGAAPERTALRSPERSSTGASSATIQRGRQRQGRLIFAAAFALAGALMLFGAFRFFARPDGARERAPQMSALEPGQGDARPAPTRTLAGVVPGTAATPELPLPDTAPPEQPARTPAPPPNAAGESARPQTHARAALPGVKAARPARSRARSSRASLTITSTPPSRVLIDGLPRGTTPLHSVRVRPGTHRVTLIYGKQRKTMLVHGDAGENALVSARFPEGETARDPAERAD